MGLTRGLTKVLRCEDGRPVCTRTVKEWTGLRTVMGRKIMNDEFILCYNGVKI